MDLSKKNIFSDLRTPGLFGKKPRIGVMMFVIGSLIFIALAFNLVNNGPLIKWDLSMAEGFHALALKSPVYVINIMIAGYYIGTFAIVAVGVLLSLYFIYKRFWRELAIAVVALGGSGLLFLILSRIFMRPRPSILFEKLIWSGNLTIPGFPSGHAKSILVCCGFLVYLLWPKIKSRPRKFLVIVSALFMVLYIGFSRLYVGDHYMTDIIAGYAVGVAWFGLVCTLIELLFKRYGKEENEPLGAKAQGTI